MNSSDLNGGSAPKPPGFSAKETKVWFFLK